MDRTAKMILMVLSAGVLLGYPTSSLQTGSNPKLIEAAKSEGTVSYYTTMTLSQSKKVADEFQAKYPFLKVDLFRGGADELLNRILTEARGGLYAWDVVSGRSDMVLLWRSIGRRRANSSTGTWSMMTAIGPPTT